MTVYRKGEALPATQILLYRMFVELLAGGWDTAKRITFESKFGRETKLILVTRLAGLLHQGKKRDATLDDFETVVAETLPAFVHKKSDILQELVRDCLLIPVGRDFTFPHFSFQEYLAAKDLGDPSGRRPAEVIEEYLGGDDWWREV